MIYLIDGHNLIGKMPDIDLADPDDEEKLIGRLQDWVRLSRKRRVTVYFDPGQQGGWGDLMGSGRVKVHFARMGQIADALIIKKVKGVSNPREFTVVTSDRAILQEVRRRRMGYILSEEFAVLLREELAAGSSSFDGEQEEGESGGDDGAAEEVELSAEEVQLWLDTFDKAPRPVRPAAPKPQKQPPQSKSIHPLSGPPPTAAELKEGIGELSDQEVAEWLTMFGDSPEIKDKPAASKLPPTGRKSPKRRTKVEPTVPDGEDRSLTPEEVDAWLAEFEKRNSDDKNS